MNRRFARRVGGHAALVVLVTAGAAQGLSGRNTVFTDDIVDGQVRYADIKDNAMTGKKILDGSLTAADLRGNSVNAAKIVDESITSADLLDDGVTKDDLAPASVGRSELGVGVLSDAVRVEVASTIGANEVGDVSASCPATNPVVVGGGFSWLDGSGQFQPGFALRGSLPVSDLSGWRVNGQNSLPQGRNLIVFAICASDGSSG